jgi:hypothetical protein
VPQALLAHHGHGNARVKSHSCFASGVAQSAACDPLERGREQTLMQWPAGR